MNVLIQNGTIITMHNRRIIHQGAISMEDKKIIGVGKNRKLKRKNRRGCEKIDAKGKVVIPARAKWPKKQKTVFWNA